MASKTPKQLFLDAITPTANAQSNVTSSLNTISEVSKALSGCAGTIAGYADPTVEGLAEQLTENAKDANALQGKMLKGASELQWLSTKYASLIDKSIATKTFSAEMRGYLQRKATVFSPIDYATDLAYLGDQITASLAELRSTVASVETTVSQLDSKLHDANDKLNKAHSDAYKASVLAGVGDFIQGVCNAATILYAAKAARAQQAQQQVQQDQQNAVVEMGEIPADHRPGAQGQYGRLEDAQERSDRIQKGAVRYLVGSALAQGISGIFQMSAKIINADPQDPSALDELQKAVDQLETYTLPLYNDHILPALSLLEGRILSAKNKLLAMSSSWIVMTLSTDTLDTNFAAWKADPSWTDASFATEMAAKKKIWADLGAAIQTYMASPYPAPSPAALLAKAPSPSPSPSSSPASLRKFPVYRRNPRALAASGPASTTADLDATHALIDLLSTPEGGPSTVSLRQAVNATNASFATLLEELGGWMTEPLDLSKHGNSLDTSVSLLLSTVEYFASKIESYLGKIEGKAALVLGALQRKLEAILETAPAILAEINASSALCASVATTLSQKVEVQDKALTAALKEFSDQKAKVQAIVDDEQRKQAEGSQTLGQAFKKMLKDGLFSKATLDFIAKLLGVDPSNSSALDQAKASLDAINAAISKASAEKQAYQVARPTIVASQASLSQLKVGLSLITPSLQKKEQELKDAAKAIDESKVDWDEFSASVPNIVAGWKAWYNSLVLSSPPAVALGLLAGPPTVLAVPKRQPLLAKARLVKTRSGPKVFKNVVQAVNPRGRPRSVLFLAAAAAPAEPPSPGSFRAKVKEALAPAADATQNAVDIASDVKLIQTKLDDMLGKLAGSTYAAELVTKVADFKKSFNALEVDAKKLATQIYWFADKNVKVLKDLETKANAGTLTVDEFQKNISYLQRKVATFVTASMDMTVKHKNLKTDMSVIEGALRSTKDTLADLIPKMQERLNQAKKDLDNEKDKMKKAAILRAVGGALSTLGQGGGLYSAVSGNAVMAGFSAASVLIGGIMSMVAGIIDGDPNQVTQLQATIDQLSIQIPDMQKAQDAMQPCIDDSVVIQQALDRLSSAWQNVSNNLVYVNQDYRSWLAQGFSMDDFLFDVDDDIKKWTEISTILRSFADGDPSTGDQPSLLTSALLKGRHTANLVLTAGEKDPYEDFLDKCAIFSQHIANTATSTLTFGQHVQGALPNLQPTTLLPFLKAIQNEAANAVQVAVSLETEGMNVVTDAGVLRDKLATLIATLNSQADQIQGKINDYDNMSIWDRIAHAFESFFGNIAHIASGDFSDIMKGLGSLANPVYGITQGTIDSIDDARNAVNQLRNAAANLQHQKETLEHQIVDVSQRKEAVSSVRGTTQNLRDAVVKLRLDVAPNELWEDFQFDLPDIRKDADQTVVASNALIGFAKN